jgi:hypothetical protein
MRPKNVQKYLNKIFEGIEALQFAPTGMITGLFSKERVSHTLKINQSCGYPESWLRSWKLK